MNTVGKNGAGMWSEADGFFYDVLHMPNDAICPDACSLDGWTDSAVRG